MKKVELKKIIELTIKKEKNDRQTYKNYGTGFYIT